MESRLPAHAFGGTEQMMARISSSFDKKLLERFQIIPGRVRELTEGVKHIAYFHDLPGDREMERFKDATFRNQFDKLVFVSDWQMQMANLHLGIPFSESIVIRNAIEPIEVDVSKKFEDSEIIQVIYHTTPHRGLGILYQVFDAISDVIPNIHLDVFSSLGIYGLPEKDKPYENLFNSINSHKNMTYHGWKPNDVIREALKKAHIFAYPSIWPETSCLAMIEAMSAGCLVVHPNYAALPDTSNKFGISYQWDENPDEHAKTFARYLYETIIMLKDKQTVISKQNFQKKFFDRFYNWHFVKNEWLSLFNQLLP